MTYLFDKYYKDKIDIKKALLVSSIIASNNCDIYEMKLVFPIEDFVGDKDIVGKLPTTNIDNFLQEKIDWLFKNSLQPLNGNLFIYSRKEKSNVPFKFIFSENEDDPIWSLELNENEYKQLIDSLEINNLPIDLFFVEDKLVSIKAKGIAGLFGITYTYTPKEYEEYLKKK